MARQLLNTLYVMTQNAYLHLENDTVRVDVERIKKLQVPLHHLGSLVCLGNIMLSPALMHRCADETAHKKPCRDSEVTPVLRGGRGLKHQSSSI